MSQWSDRRGDYFALLYVSSRLIRLAGGYYRLDPGSRIDLFSAVERGGGLATLIARRMGPTLLESTFFKFLTSGFSPNKTYTKKDKKNYS
jgi:hypothetical protein